MSVIEMTKGVKAGQSCQSANYLRMTTGYLRMAKIPL
jgi:hypothetical protein